MAYEPTQWRSGDTITSERLNKMEQGIAGSGSGDAYVLHTTMTVTPAENEGGKPTVTYSSVELREDGLPMWLIVDHEASDVAPAYAEVGTLISYDNEIFSYSSELDVRRSTGEVGYQIGGTSSGDGGLTYKTL